MSSRAYRVRTPRVIQMEAVECGAASLSIILSYYGRYLPLEELRTECSVSRDGVNALNLIKAARKYGLYGQGYRKKEEELQKIQFPAILFWEFNHFLVLEGFGKNKVYLNDPARGPYFISHEEFTKKYAGIVLVFEKEKEFLKGGKPHSLIKQLYERLKTTQNPLSFLFLTAFLLLLPGFALPACLMAFINLFFQQHVFEWTWGFLGAVLLTALFSGALTWTRQYYLNRLSYQLSLKFSSDFLWHLLKLPMSFYTQRYTGEIAYRMSLNDSVAENVANTLLSTTVDLLLIIFYALLMFSYDSSIAWIGMIVAICNFTLMFFISGSRLNAYARLQQNMSKTITESIGGLHHIETIKAKGAESDFFSKWAGHYTNTFNSSQEIGKKDVILTTMPLFFQLLASVFLLSIGSLRIIEGSLSVGMLMALQLLQINFLQPIQRFAGFNQLIQNTKIDLDRLNDVLKNKVDSSYRKQLKSKKKRLDGRLEFKNVTFGYALSSPPLIQDLSFLICPGQRLALVGPSGSGKSTVAKLASGLFHPWSGQILYDDIPIEELPKELLCNSLSAVDQSIFLFSGTIRENLTLWNTKLSQDVLIKATEAARIHEEILMRPGNYESLLIEGGGNLSGGQRQRLEIARSLLYNPSILILDEATSSLDSKVEKEISDSIALRGCSVLMIAHRLSTVQDCHEILVLNEGNIVQRGSHQGLKSTPGIYRELILSEVPE